MHVSSSSWFSREYSSYFCSNLKPLKTEGIWNLGPFWGQGSWDGWAYRSHGCLPQGSPTQMAFVYTGDGRDHEHKGQNGQHFQWIDTDVWSLKTLPHWHSGTFSGTFISMLFCFCLFVWANNWRNLKKKMNCLNVKYKMWLVLNNVCVSNSSSTLKRQKAYFVSQPA